MKEETAYKHIICVNGVAFIDGTTMRVVDLVLELKAYGLCAEELQQHYSFLSQGHISSALAYYRDRQEEMDRDIAHLLYAPADDWSHEGNGHPIADEQVDCEALAALEQHELVPVRLKTLDDLKAELIEEESLCYESL